MADAASVDGPSLKSEFNLKSLWHASHWVMFGSMVIGSIAAVVATGGASALLDPFGPLLSMYVDGYSQIGSLGDFFSSAVENAGNGVFVSDAIGAVGSHAGHAAAAGADMVGHCTSEAFNATLSGMSGADFVFNQELAKSAGGDMVGQLEGLCHGVG